MLSIVFTDNRSQVINRIASVFGMPKSQAEDIWQESWLEFFKKVNNGELSAIPENIVGYLWGISKNKVNDFYRERKKNYDFVSLDAFEEEDEHNSYHLELEISEVAESLDYEHRIELRKCEILDSLMAQVPEKHRALVQEFYEGKNMKQLAIELGFKDETVAKSTKYRILNMLSENAKKHNLYNDAA